MELQAKARHLPFMTASARLKDRFHITMDDDTFIERAYFIWRSIGNIAVVTKFVEVTVGADLIVTLPDDCEFVKSLTTADFRNFTGGSYGDYSFSSKGRSPEVKVDPATVSVESNVRTSISTVPGERISYQTYDGYIKVESQLMAGQKALLIYNAISVGEDGLPLLNDLEVEAIAITMALRHAEESLFRREQGSDKIVAYLAPLSERALCDAKADEKISDDGLDQLLDIKTSFNRKVYGSKFNFNQ